MKITIEFDDQDDAITAIKGSDWKLVVWSLDQSLRNHIKYSSKDEPLLQSVRDKLHELLSDYDLKIDV